MSHSIPIVISVLSLALGVWNFIEQKRMKKNDVLESRWRHFLDRLDSLKVSWPDTSDDTGPATVALLAGASYMKEPSLEEFSRRITNYAATNHQLLDIPPALYDTFRALANLYNSAPKDKRNFLDDSLPPHTTSRHVGRTLIKAAERADYVTILFLIESGLLDRFSMLGVTGPSLEILRRACIVEAQRQKR